MTEWRFIVQARVRPEAEDAWNAWYDTVHLPEIAGCPGFRSATRMVAEGRAAKRFITEYEIDGPDALRTPEFASARGWYEFSELIEAETQLYEVITRLPRTDARS